SPWCLTAFAERLRGHWGEFDLPQYMAAIDALRAEGLVSEVAAFGHSYGAFLTGWALVERMPLLAAVVSAGVLDQHSHAGTSDTGYYVGPYGMSENLVCRLLLEKKKKFSTMFFMSDELLPRPIMICREELINTRLESS